MAARRKHYKLTQRILNGVCAIGYFSTQFENMKDRIKPYFQVVGTGFLVQPTILITSLGVIYSMKQKQEELGIQPDQFFLTFYLADGNNFPTIAVRQIRHIDYSTCEFGIIEYKIISDKHCDKLNHLIIAESSQSYFDSKFFRNNNNIEIFLVNKNIIKFNNSKIYPF